VSNRKPRLVFLATEYYFFHAMAPDLAPAPARAAFDVVVVAFRGNSAGKEPTPGLTVIDFDWRRSRSLWRAALQFLPELLRVRRVLRELQPDILHKIALKPTIIGSLAMWNAPTRIVNTLTGLGFVFYARSAIARIGQWFCGIVLRHAVRHNDAHVVVHNTVDQHFVQEQLSLPANRVRLVRGLGIDTNHFALLPPPLSDTPFRFLMIARLLYMKGIAVAVAAQALLRQRGREAELVVCGGPDADNPSAIPDEVVAQWTRQPGVRFRGQVMDVRTEIAQAHVVMHPALGGEGLPRVLLEGAACGRPLIATDVSGNSDIVIPNENGLLIRPDDAAALADAMQWMMDHPAARERFGQSGRTRVLQELASEHVAAGYMDLYTELSP
jgi:glycosyltransferase involved in cell wall biosynthesis